MNRRTSLFCASSGGGKTVWDHLAEAIYLDWMGLTGLIGCEALFDLFIERANRRRSYEQSVSPPDKGVLLILLSEEADMLQRYVDRQCPDTSGAIRRTLARLRARIAELGQ